MRRSGRHLLSIILIIAIAFSVAGCKGKPVARQAETKDELVIALDRYTAKKPPEGLGVATCTQVFEPLLFLNKKLEIQPGLVTSWERLDDLTWRFNLRKGVKFHNGKEFDAESAKFAFTVYLDMMKKGYVYERVKEVVDHNSFKIVDKYTLEIKTLRPYPFLPYLMTHPSIVAMDPDAFNKGEIVGTGPFKFKEEAKDQYVIVERNENYWGEKPFFKRVVFKIVPDPNTRILALKTGDVDVAVYPSLPSLKELEKEYNTFYVFKGLPFLMFNFSKPYIKDINFRKALCMAVDKENIAKEIYYGTADPANSLIPKGLLYSIEDEYQGFPYNPVEAKKLLEESGYSDSNNDGYIDKNGKNIEIIFPYFASEAEYKSIAETIASSFEEIGIKTKIVTLEAAAYDEVILEKGNYDVCLDATGIFWGSSSTMLYDHFYSKSGLLGFHRIKDAEVDKLIEKGMELESRKDFKGAAQKYKTAQKRAIDELVGLYPVVFQKHVVVAKKNVKNFSPFPYYGMFYNGDSDNLLVNVRWEE